MKKSKLLLGMSLLFASFLCFCIALVGFSNQHKNRTIYDDIRKQVKIYNHEKKETVNDENKDTQDDVIMDFDALHDINEDIRYWINIPGTLIDFPVLVGKGNDYYLSHDIMGNRSIYGSIFLDERLDGITKTSKNIIIYGHNMGTWSNEMFSTLDDFLDVDYQEKHRKALLYETNKARDLQLVSVLKVNQESDFFQICLNDDLFNQWKEEYIPDYSDSDDVVILTTCSGTSRVRIALIYIDEK